MGGATGWPSKKVSHCRIINKSYFKTCQQGEIFRQIGALTKHLYINIRFFICDIINYCAFAAMWVKQVPMIKSHENPKRRRDGAFRISI